jgi:transposase
MLTLPPSVGIFVCTVPADMRRGFDGLARMAQEIVRQDPLSGL